MRVADRRILLCAYTRLEQPIFCVGLPVFERLWLVNREMKLVIFIYSSWGEWAIYKSFLPRLRSTLFCITCIACNVCIGVCHFVHRSPSLVSFRHSNDERNPPDVTGTPAPVEAPGGRQRLDQNLDVQLVKGVLHESRYQNSHLSRHRPSSSEDALPHAFGRRALWG